jgi:hypothetical protein
MIESGDHAGKFGLKFLKTKDPCSVRFDVDEYMNIKPDGILITAPDGNVDNHDLVDFAVYTYRRRFNNPYGYGDALRAFDPWNAKVKFRKFMNIEGERQAMGTFVGQYPDDPGGICVRQKFCPTKTGPQRLAGF